MSSSRCPAIMTERPSLPGIHDLFGEHLALPIRRSSPFALNALSSTLPTKFYLRSLASQTYYGHRETNAMFVRRSEKEEVTSQSHYKSYQKGTKEFASMESSRIPAQRYSPSPHYISREHDNYSPPSSRASSAGSGDERFEPRASPPERKKLPAKYECEFCGKFFNRPSSLKIHHNTHTGQKPFTCVFPGCGRSFSVMSNMRRHARTHGDSAVLSAREQSDSELTSIHLTPVPGFIPSPSAPNSRGSSRSATPLSYQSSRMPSRVPSSRGRSSSLSSDSSI